MAGENIATSESRVGDAMVASESTAGDAMDTSEAAATKDDTLDEAGGSSVSEGDAGIVGSAPSEAIGAATLALGGANGARRGSARRVAGTAAGGC